MNNTLKVNEFNNIIIDMLENSMYELKQGNSNALDVIYKETNKMVYSVCFSMLRNSFDAEDAMMETYLNVRKYINSYKENTNASAWISTIARNICKNKLKSNKRVTYVDEFYDSDTYSRSSSDKQTKDKATKIMDIAKEVLNEKELYILIEHVINEKNLVDIAKDLEANDNTIRWAYNNALAKIRRRLGKEA